MGRGFMQKRSAGEISWTKKEKEEEGRLGCNQREQKEIGLNAVATPTKHTWEHFDWPLSISSKKLLERSDNAHT